MKKQYAGNPLITSLFTADPSAHTWDGEKLYIYASRDIEPSRGCDFMDRYHVFSTTDMANWLDEGEILRSDDVSWGRPEGGFMWAPDCACRNGKYYYYFPHPSETAWNESWKIGVAISDYPNKGFKDAGYIEGLGGFALIDPAVFVDEDGSAYIYYGGGGKCFGGRLNDDMISLASEMNPMEGLYDFHEAVWVFKREGLYYITYSDNVHGANNMRYCTSKTPLGPWEHKGIYLTPVGCETTHGSVVEFKGRWYQFYHNNSISNQGELRSVCADELFFGENGEMLLIEQTSCGLAAVDDSYTPPDRKIYRPDGSLEFKCVDGGNGGWANLLFRYTTGANRDKLRLFVNGEDLGLMNCLGRLSETDQTVVLLQGQVNTVRCEVIGEAEITSLEVAWLDKL